MHSFHYLSVILCAFLFSCSPSVAAFGVHDRSPGLLHKRAPGWNHEPHALSTDQPEYSIFSKRDQFTYFQDGQGACGSYNSPSDFIVALNSCDYAGGAHCFQMITITIGGKSTQAQITDECPGCPCGGLDFSQGLFEFFAPTSVGELTGTWSYGSGASTTSTSLPPSTTTTRSSTSTWTPSSTTSFSSTSSTIATTSIPTTTSMSTTSSSSSSTTTSSTSTSSTALPVPTFNPTDPQMLTQGNLALIEFGSLLQACAVMSF